MKNQSTTVNENLIELSKKLHLPEDVQNILENCQGITFPKTRNELINLSFGGEDNDLYEDIYEIEGKGKVVEATVTRCKNGVAVNYSEDYMRRRDPNCMLIADDKVTDKERYENVYNESFDIIRTETFDWLKSQELIVLPFMSGGPEYGYASVLIAPKRSAFFACILADLQGFLSMEDLSADFVPKAIVYLAPPFRHTHFDGKQRVIHNRLDNTHEVFSYNLYPGPSAKKGIYGVLLNIGEAEGWITAHASTVKVITPYDNEIVIMHEGASGGGKSEMTEKMHKADDERYLVGHNLETDEKFYIELSDTCELRPVTDDMAFCHKDMQNDSKKLVVQDAEYGWFLRLDHLTCYGTSPQYEKIFTHPEEPLLFLNIQGVPKSTVLVWEHTIDSNGKPCPNPRAILPRRLVPNIVKELVEVDVRSFGVRVPPCTKENPTYGIMGMLHILPPALAWLWRLVAPRGYNNPSIITSNAMSSEGVGSYWPFATGKMVEQANLLLDQIVRSENTRYVLIPNQHVGAYKVGFMPQWIAREYIARRGGAKFKPSHLKEARCNLLGYCLDSLKIDGQNIRKAFLQTDTQSEVGIEGYDAGAKQLTDFFKEELKKFDTPDLDPLGKSIIDCFMRDGSIQEYIDLVPMRY